MIGLDTNVLVRLLVEDDEDQHARVVALLQRGSASAFFIGDVVLAESCGSFKPDIDSRGRRSKAP